MIGPKHRAFTTAIVSLALGGLLLLLLPGRNSTATQASSAADQGARRQDELASQLKPLNGPTGTMTSTELYLPFIPVIKPPDVELLNTWIADSNDVEQQGFLPGDDLSYRTVILVNPAGPATSTLTINSTGLCDSGQVFSGTLILDQGVWEHVAPAQAQSCTGLFTTTTILSEKQYTPTRITNHVVNQLSQVVVSEQAGFDKCAVPTVEKMQTWWDESPYSVINLYLGGAAFACPNQDLDAVWVYKVAQQGWDYILTWVGPQAPCTGYLHRISSNPATAYQEGKSEAAAAVVAARHQGFFGNEVIYYDIEAYPNASQACRDAVDSFITGWTEQLHDLGLKAGGYGQPCTSYMTDWVSNSPSLDDVWLAHWITNYYSPTVTVWDAPCVINDMWDDHQRIKQYTGGHSEEWGGVALTLDSNVLDGEVTRLPVSSTRSVGELQSVTLINQGPIIRDMGLLGPNHGWVWAGERIILTADGGARWQDITPDKLIPIGAAFDNPRTGLIVGVGTGYHAVQVARTINGGSTWEYVSLPLDPGEAALVESAFMDIVDEQTLWLALRLATGASFSQGLLFFSSDGGLSWEQKTIPLGEPVKFLDAERGWTAGGPAGDLLYHTQDGGWTWQQSHATLPEALAELPGMTNFIMKSGFDGWEELTNQIPEGGILVDSYDNRHIWAIIQEGSCTGDKVSFVGPANSDPFECTQQWTLMASDDGGHTWKELDLKGL